MRIIQVIIGLGVGGAERVVVSLADGMADRGHEVRIISLMDQAGTLPSHNVEVVHLGLSRNPLRAVSAIWKLAGEIRRFRPDVVHSHMKHSNLVTRLLRFVVPIPRLVNTVHSTHEGGKAWMAAYRVSDGLADAVTNVSREASAAYEVAGAVPNGRMLTIHNGIDVGVNSFSFDRRVAMRQKLDIDDEEKLVLAVGRLTPPKDYPNLVSALQRLRRGGRWTAVIAGDGPMRQKLELLVQECGLADHVRFLGVRNDIPALMSAADVFVLSSAWEGFGMVVAEAMACERLVVATDCGGVREVLGDCGFLVPPGSPDALAAALVDALALAPEKAAALGLKARERVIEMFSLEAAIESWQALYSAK